MEGTSLVSCSIQTCSQIADLNFSQATSLRVLHVTDSVRFAGSLIRERP